MSPPAASAPDLTSTIARIRDNPALSRLYDRQSSMVPLSKWSSYYVGEARIPAAQCRNCVWWVAPEGEAKGACRLVSSDGGPTEGSIPATATCNLWNAGPVRIRLISRLRGRGKDAQGLAPGNLRYHLERITIQGEHATPPLQVQKRLVFPNGLQSGTQALAEGLVEGGEETYANPPVGGPAAEGMSMPASSSGGMHAESVMMIPPIIPGNRLAPKTSDEVRKGLRIRDGIRYPT